MRNVFQQCIEQNCLNLEMPGNQFLFYNHFFTDDLIIIHIAQFK